MNFDGMDDAALTRWHDHRPTPQRYRLWVYRVTGRGMFPCDMLRYDRAFPRSESDALTMEASGALAPRSIELNGLAEPTERRWASFGWQVKPLDCVTINRDRFGNELPADGPPRFHPHPPAARPRFRRRAGRTARPDPRSRRR